MNKNTAKERLQEKLNKNKKNLFHHTKNIRRGLYSTLIGIPANILQGLRRAAKLGDMHISEKEFLSQMASKDPSFVKKTLQFVEKGILRGMYVATLALSLGYGTHKVTQSINDSSGIEVIQDKEEITKDTYNPTIQKIADTPTANTYRDSNIDFFDQSKFHEKCPRETIEEGITLIRDVGMSFYIVQKGDNPTKIRKKLKKIPEFSYLDDDRHNPKNKLFSFNIPAEHIIPGRFIPIPLPLEMREISFENFTNYAVQALEEMKTNTHYSSKLEELLQHTTHDEIIAAMLTFARCETAQDHTSFSDEIGATVYHRREDHYRAFSFTPFHILMEKNKDKITNGPGLQARLKLQLDEGQMYHPKNACKLFLGYRFEKTKNGDIKNYIPITEKNYRKLVSTYNGCGGSGCDDYETKLKTTYTYVLDKLDIKTANRSQTTKLKGKSFEFVGYNSTGEYKVYKYIIKQGGNPGGIAQKLLEENDNIDLVNITISDVNGKLYKPDHNFKSGDIVYVKIK